ncbi:hypothetical protein BDV26DRAFT_5383 [Aspergillus bertholletiae]|uniref:Uncharacterized protein n=1 Tax=Aspergillus bertholletiae TaxID=1226010 RepID=A0A5N7BL22_9EURO|nr:hypothetical protein BDV26DRAFT_5383 [Aspergillus bertholletiae]
MLTTSCKNMAWPPVVCTTFSGVCSLTTAFSFCHPTTCIEANFPLAQQFINNRCYKPFRSAKFIHTLSVRWIMALFAVSDRRRSAMMGFGGASLRNNLVLGTIVW